MPSVSGALMRFWQAEKSLSELLALRWPRPSGPRGRCGMGSLLAKNLRTLGSLD